MCKCWMRLMISLLMLMMPFGAAAETLELPEGTTRIEDEAFAGCIQFTGNLVIPQGVTYIGTRAFADCTGLTGTVVIPESVAYLAKDAFEGCDVSVIKGCYEGTAGLEYERTEDGYIVTGYSGDNAADIVIPAIYEGEPVIAIDSRAFYNRKALSGTLSLPDTVTSIGNYAFYNCDSLSGSLVLPASLESIGNYAFYQCSALTGSLVLPNSLVSLGKYAFSYCSNLKGELKLSRNLTSISINAFEGCRFTGSLELPDNLETIEMYAFSGCDFSGELLLPQSLKYLGDCTFQWCGFTGALVLPDGIGSVGMKAFEGCSFSGTLRIPEGVQCSYQEFYQCGSFDELILPADITFIGEEAFYNTDFAGELLLPAGVKTIGDRAFFDCGFSGNLVLPESLTSIGESVFVDCGFSGKLSIPPSLTKIGSGAFSGCKNLEMLDLRGNVSILDSYVFSSCSGLVGAIIPSSITSIYSSSAFAATFKDCNSLSILGETGSAAEAYASEMGIPFVLWDLSSEIIPPIELGNGIPFGYYQILDSYSMAEKRYYRAKLIKEYKGISVRDEGGYRNVFLDEQLNAITDADTLSKLFTVYLFGKERKWEANLAAWKTSALSWSASAVDIMRDELLTKNLGSVLGNAIAAIYSGGATALENLRSIAETVVQSAVLGVEIAYIEKLTDHLNETIDFAISCSVYDDSGVVNYERVVEFLKLYEYIAVSYYTDQGLCIPIIEEILEKYDADWQAGIANVATMFSEMAGAQSTQVQVSINLIQRMLEGDVLSLNTMADFLKLLEHEFTEKTIMNFGMELLLSSVELYEAFAGVTIDQAQKLTEPYFFTVDEVKTWTLYQDQLIFAE